MSDLRTVPAALLRQALELLQSAYVATALVWPRHDCVEALRAALEQPEPMCVGCEGKPTLQNSPCAVCGKIAQQEQGPVAWMVYTLDGKSVLITDTPADFNKQYRVLPLYTRPAEPEPPPEPIHEDKIRHRYQELAQYCEPGDMLDDDWFEAGVRWAEAQHEIV